MQFKCNNIYLPLIQLVFLFSMVKSCPDVPIDLDEEFAECCRAHPRYTSEPCIDDLLANGTFSSVCLVNCMYREFEMYNGAEVDLDAVKTFLTTHIADDHFHLSYMNAFERCAKLDKNTLKEKFEFVEFGNIYDCDEYPQYMDICVWYFTLANCPEPFARKDVGCMEKRKWINECL